MAWATKQSISTATEIGEQAVRAFRQSGSIEDGLAQASVAISGARGQYEELYQTLYGRILPPFAIHTWEELMDERGLRQEEDGDGPTPSPPGQPSAGSQVPPASTWDEAVEAFMREEGGDLIKNVTDNQRRRIMGTIRRLVDEGKSFHNIVNELERTVPNISRVKGRRVARTETVRASNRGADAGARETGLDLDKTWLATLDRRVRDSHATADGQTVGMNEMFTVGGFEAPYPAAASLPPRHSVMCRCTATYQTK